MNINRILSITLSGQQIVAMQIGEVSACNLESALAECVIIGADPQTQAALVGASTVKSRRVPVKYWHLDANTRKGIMETFVQQTEVM